MCVATQQPVEGQNIPKLFGVGPVEAKPQLVATISENLRKKNASAELACPSQSTNIMAMASKDYGKLYVGLSVSGDDYFSFSDAEDNLTKFNPAQTAVVEGCCSLKGFGTLWTL